MQVETKTQVNTQKGGSLNVCQDIFGKARKINWQANKGLSLVYQCVTDEVRRWAGAADMNDVEWKNESIKVAKSADTW